MDIFYDKNNKMIKGAIEKDVEIINKVFKSFILPLESTKSLIQSLETIEDPYKGNSDFLYYIIDKLIKRELEIPKLSTTTTKLIELLSNKDAPFDDYAALVKLEPFIAAKIMKLANSSFYRGNYEITSIEMAITRLGLKKLKEIVMVLAFDKIVFNTQKGKELVLESWKYSVYTALTSQEIIKLLKDNEIDLEAIYTTSLLKGIGEFIVLAILDDYLKINEGAPVPDDTFIYRLINSFKYKISSIVLKEWNFSKDIYMSIAHLEGGLKKLETKQERIIFFADKVSFLFYKNRFEVLNQASFYEALMDITGLVDIDLEALLGLKEFLDKESSAIFTVFG